MTANNQLNQNLLETINDQSFTPGKKKTIIAAIELFSEQGFNATTTAQIAKRAGVSEGTIFKYFRTKEQLLDDVLEPLMEKLIPTYQVDFLDHFNQKETYNAEQLARMIIQNRYQFFIDNEQLLKILLEELLVNPKWKKKLIQTGKQQAEKLNDQFNKTFSVLLGNKEITFFEFFIQLSRILIGYFVQRLVMNSQASNNPEKDIDLMAQQLLLAVHKM